ncbi:MAG: HDOD domain-containing protein [Nitrosomonadales bacterium]|nr:HDOD domain-containing protein [Nitrosomonadales bacterium]
MNKAITELVQGVDNLITLPDVFVRINRLVEDANSNMADIAKVAGQDPSFSMRLLRVANSTFYGFPSTIDTIPKAVSIIGTSQIRSLALATSVASSFEGLPNSLVSMGNFWRHSLYCAIAARILCKQAHKCDPDAVFTAALLHDIGELVIFNRMPQQAKEVLYLVLDSADELPVYLAERQIMGFDHAQVGGELARQWQLPPMLVECIECHHDIRSAQHFPRETALVHIANSLALMAETQTLDQKDVSPIDQLAWQIVGLDAGQVIPAVVGEAQEMIAEAEKLFIGK